MNLWKPVAMLAAGMIVLAGCQKAAEDTSADEAKIRESAPAFADAFNAGDVEKLTAMYWDDAVLLPPGTTGKSGTAAIREFFAADTAAVSAAGLKFVIPEAGAVDVSGDLAYESGTYSVTDASGATVDTGKYIGVFQKREGEWRYIRDTWNSDTPPPAPVEAAPAESAPAAE